MQGLTQRQSDAVFEVMARYEGFVRFMAADFTQHQPGGNCMHCQAEKVLKECRELIRGPQAA